MAFVFVPLVSSEQETHIDSALNICCSKGQLLGMRGGVTRLMRSSRQVKQRAGSAHVQNRTSNGKGAWNPVSSLRGLTVGASVFSTTALAASGAAIAAEPVSPSQSVTQSSNWLADYAEAISPFMETIGFSPEMAVDPAMALNTSITVGALGLSAACCLWALRSSRRAAKSAYDADFQVSALAARIDDAEAILAAEPDAVFIWTPETMVAKPGTLQARPRILGATAGLADPATGELDFDYLLSRLEGEHPTLLRQAADRLRSRGARFSLVVQSRDGRIFEAEGRPAGAQAVLWFRDVTGERAEVARLSERLRTAESGQEKFSEHADSLPLPAWRRDAEDRLVWVNAAYVHAVEGTSAQDVISQAQELFGEEARAESRRQLAEMHKADHRTFAVVAGERRALNIREAVLSEGTAGIAIDVTALDHAEGELKRHIGAHASTLNQLATAVAIFGPDQHLTFFNDAFQSLWSLEHSFLESEPLDSAVLDELRTRRRLPEQANYQEWKAKRLEQYTAPEASEEYWHLPDGRTIRAVTQPHPFGGVIYLYENVTERINLESSYTALEDVQRETLDNLYEGVAVFGTDGQLKLFNPAYAQTWRLEEDELNQSPHINDIILACSELYDDGEMWAEIRSFITGVGRARTESAGRIERPDGTVIDYALVPLPDGATLLAYVDVTDSTRIERALRDRNEALETADRLKSEFVSHMSYQLRTPLTNIIGFGEILEAKMFGDLNEKQQEYMAGILESSHQLLDVVNDILDLATVEAGAMTLDVSTVEIADVISAAEEFATRTAQKGKLSLTVECPDDIGTIQADERRIKQIMINLLSNAISFTRPGDAILIGAHREEDELLLYVSDTGDGIKPEHQATVFDRFEARDGGPDSPRGAGLGLSLVKSFIELHGGWVTLESEPNVGTRVTCHLPIQRADDPKTLNKPVL